MAHYVVVMVTPTSEDWIPEYIATVTPLVNEYGGKYLARTTSHQRFEGAAGGHPAFIAIVEFPSEEAAKAFYNDPAYEPHLQARQANAINDFFVVAGKDDFA